MTGNEAAASEARVSSSSTQADLQSATVAPQLTTTTDPRPTTGPAVPSDEWDTHITVSLIDDIAETVNIIDAALSDPDFPDIRTPGDLVWLREFVDDRSMITGANWTFLPTPCENETLHRLKKYRNLHVLQQPNRVERLICV